MPKNKNTIDKDQYKNSLNKTLRLNRYDTWHDRTRVDKNLQSYRTTAIIVIVRETY